MKKNSKGKRYNSNSSYNLSLKLYIFFQRYPILRYFKITFYFIDFFLLLFIKKPKKIQTEKKKIFIMYNYAFGDGVIWLNEAKELRKIYNKKDYELILMCQKGLNTLYENEKVFDKVIPYDLIKATFNLKNRFKLFKTLRETYYDIVIDFIGVYECTTNVFASRAIHAGKKISIIDKTLDKRLCPRWLAKKIYDEVVEITKPHLSLIEYYAEMIRFLGNKEYKVEFSKNKSIKINKNLNLPEKYFIIFPGASTYLKKWDINKYAEIATRVYKKTNLPIVFCGTGADIDSINALKLLIPNIPSYDIVEQTSLLEFIEVIKKASLVITNDTSTYHIAVINQTPVAIITGGYTYDRYVSYHFENEDKYLKPCIIVHKMDCFNCDNRCPYLKTTDKNWPCLKKITVNYAWEKIEKYIIDNKIGD